MTTAHKITLFGLVMARLIPYRERLQHKCELKIEFSSTGKYGDTIDVTVIRWGDNRHIEDHEWLVYHFDEHSERNINAFIDEAVEKIKPFIN